MKWADLRPEVDPLSGEVVHDERFFDASEADKGALEWGLRLAERWGARLTVVTAGPAGADPVLRDALALGAHDARRVDMALDRPSEHVAAALGSAVQGADLVLCGVHSVDRGSGSVPALLAARLGAAQALGVIAVAPGAAGELTVDRRLDFGRRERLRVAGPAVVSLEGGLAELRRAPLASVLAARTAPITVVDAGLAPQRATVRVEHRRAYRPRARVMHAPDPSAPVNERIIALTGALTERTPPRTVAAEPDEAADAIVEQLRGWGYLQP
nr:mycofactocin-associated electron transfer flavoprotein beta subunit [Rhabdothermincola salaria]